jgi:hypothetical protein
MTTPSELYPIVFSFLEANGKKKAAQKLKKEANLVLLPLSHLDPILGPNSPCSLSSLLYPRLLWMSSGQGHCESV